MAFDMAAVVKAIGDVVAGETTVAAVYTAAEHGEGGMVGAVNTFPSVLVFPGPTRLYRLTQPRASHTYEVRLQVLQAGGDTASRAATVLPVCDALIAKFAVNVTLGAANPAPSSTVVKCLFERQSGLIDIEFGDIRFLGYEITLLVEEQTAVSAVTGGS
jgi:hypothetical protein